MSRTTRKLLAKFKDGGKYLASPFSQWSVAETLEFFHTRDMPTKVEKELRVFPSFQYLAVGMGLRSSDICRLAT